MGLYKRCDCTNQARCPHPWWYVFKAGGLKFRRSTRTTSVRDAERAERQARAKSDAISKRRQAAPLTLDDIKVFDLQRAASAGVSDSHLARLAEHWGMLTSRLDGVSPRRIGYAEITAYVAARRGEGALGQTVIREVQALKRGMTEAYRRGLPVLPPIDWPTVRRDPPSERYKGRNHPLEVLSRWLDALSGDARDEAELALLTGLRHGELKRIAWSWVEASKGLGVPAVLHVPAWAAKNRRPRTVALTRRALAILERRAEGQPDDVPLLSQAGHRTAYRLAREAIGYDRPITLRDLRHTWATQANQSVGIDAARDGLGHSTLAVTQRYISGDLSRVAQAARAIDRRLGGHSRGTHGARKRRK